MKIEIQPIKEEKKFKPFAVLITFEEESEANNFMNDLFGNISCPITNEIYETIIEKLNNP